MNPALIALMIFCLRICDVSIGTVRVIFTIRGNRPVSAALGFLESLVWIFAISRAMKYVDNPVSMIAWAAGFAAGAVLGITLERWIATGHIIMRVISLDKPVLLRDALREAGVGVTSVPGEGRGGALHVLFAVAPRKRGKEMIKIVQGMDPGAFITIDPVSQAIGGFLPGVVEASAVRK
ncbi:MAG: DUF5698 domain-containing protein [Tepidisphaeraceae bacterium]